MGNTSSQDTQDEHQQNFYHPELGKLIQLRDQDPTLQMKAVLPSKQEYTTWADQLPRLSSENQVVLIPLRHQYKETGFCGFTGTAILEFEYFPFQLDLEINQRMSKEHRFSQFEVWYVMFTLLEAVVDIEQAPQKVMDIRPRNVVLSPQGQVKLITKLTYPSFQNALAKAISKKDTCFLSPEELDSLQLGNVFPKLLFPVCQLFSIGLTIFQACALRRCEGLYNMDHYKFDSKALEAYFKELIQEGLYSRFLIRTLQLMLETDPNKRLSCGQLWSSLLPYESEIVSLQSFTPSRQNSLEFIDKYYRTIETWPHFAEYSKTKGTRKLPFDVTSPPLVHNPVQRASYTSSTPTASFPSSSLQPARTTHSVYPSQPHSHLAHPPSSHSQIQSGKRPFSESIVWNNNVPQGGGPSASSPFYQAPQ